MTTQTVRVDPEQHPHLEAVMAAHGRYDRHSVLQAASAETAVVWVAEAAAAAPLPQRPFCIADYGAAGGRNSVAPVRAAIGAVRTRSDLAIQVVHTDLPGNDFTLLFR